MAPTSDRRESERMRTSVATGPVHSRARDKGGMSESDYPRERLDETTWLVGVLG